MSIKPRDVNEFINAVKDAREHWLQASDGSWREIKKLQKNGKWWSIAPNSARKSVKFPLWNSTFKIRKPLVYSRQPIPICKDTSQGDDPIGRAAATCKERLAHSILKSFDFNEAMYACRDDRLITEFGVGRIYFEIDKVEEYEKVPVVQVQDQFGNVRYEYDDGEPVEDDRPVSQDDEGFYVQTSKLVDVENERVCFKHVLYSEVYIDPTARRWSDVKKLAFEHNYTEAEFKRIYGTKAFEELSVSSIRTTKDRKSIKVYEYWDLYEDSVYWLPENGTQFVRPTKDYAVVEESEDESADPYELSQFFPCPRPMIGDAPTDSFYPITEYYQVADLLHEINTLATRIYVCTRAIRARALFDGSVPALQSLINEVAEADFIGVDGLGQMLQQGGSNLENLVYYLPVDKQAQALERLYQALAQRLQSYYELTGTSDLLRGQTDSVERTYGEQQLKAKYAMNQIEPAQSDMQRFCRDTIELLCECALKNFSDDTLKDYISPETMEPVLRGLYGPAMALLKEDRKARFKIDLETDSTLALNEQYQKQVAIEMVNSLTGALKSTADIIKQEPALAVPMVRMVQHLSSVFQQGKLFKDEISKSFSDVLTKVQQMASQPPAPDPKTQELQLRGQEIQVTTQLKTQELTIGAQERTARIQLDAQKQQGDFQVQAQELQIKTQEVINAARKAEQDYQLAFANLQLRQQELLLKREETSIMVAKLNAETLTDQQRLALESQIAQSEASLAKMAHDLETYRVTLDEREKYMTEARLQFEARLQAMDTQVRAQMESQRSQEIPQPQPIIVTPPQARVTRKISTPIRDEMGNITSVETVELPIEEAI